MSRLDHKMDCIFGFRNKPHEKLDPVTPDLDVLKLFKNIHFLFCRANLFQYPLRNCN